MKWLLYTVITLLIASPVFAPKPASDIDSLIEEIEVMSYNIENRIDNLEEHKRSIDTIVSKKNFFNRIISSINGNGIYDTSIIDTSKYEH